MSIMTVGSGARVAVRTDPILGIREDALFLPAHEDVIFCVVHRPQRAARGAVVICCSLYAEQLKLYRAEVLLARTLTREGVAVARFHYRGTGHSGGLPARVTLASMLEDAAIVGGFLRQGLPPVPLVFCGARWGGLVAGLAAARHPGAPLVLWEPVVQGMRFFEEILRARQMSALAGRTLAAAQRSSAPEELQTRGWIDAMGYPIHRALYESARDVGLAAVASSGPRPVLLVQVNRRSDLRAEASALRDAFVAVGSHVAVGRIEVDEAWSFIGKPLRSADALIGTTHAFLLHWISGGR